MTEVLKDLSFLFLPPVFCIVRMALVVNFLQKPVRHELLQLEAPLHPSVFSLVPGLFPRPAPDPLNFQVALKYLLQPRHPSQRDLGFSFSKRKACKLDGALPSPSPF